MADERDARLAYFGLITGQATNYSGFFLCRMGAFASENMFDEAEVSTIFETLQQRGLIEYDNASSWVRIVGWFYGRYAPQNADEAVYRSRLYLENCPPLGPITNSAIAEFVVATLRSASFFKSKSKQPPEIYAFLRNFLRDAFSVHLGLYGRLEQEFEIHGNFCGRHLVGAADELLAFAKSLSDQPTKTQCGQGVGTVPAGWGHPVGTVVTQKEKKEEKEKRRANSANGTAHPLAETLSSKIAMEARRS